MGKPEVHVHRNHIFNSQSIERQKSTINNG